MKMKVEPEYAGLEIECPGCNTRVTVPAESAAPAPAPKESEETFKTQASTVPKREIPVREGWAESDPTNPNTGLAIGIGIGIAILIWVIGFGLKGVSIFVFEILFKRGWVNYAETICFGWGAAILILKVGKLKHQRKAMALDIMPDELGREINRDNVGKFIDYIYEIPGKLRDSTMVNRIRKGLELFESRQANAEVATMMENQSNIDAIRIGGSYNLVKIFVAIIPLLGFIGTVLGLSSAIGGFSGVMGGAGNDINKLMDSLGGVTAGLGTAFDTTLLGLLYSIILLVPANTLQKIEDDNLNHIDNYCNETLMPRLNDGGNVAGGDMGGFLDMLVSALVRAQSQFLGGINKAAETVKEQSTFLEKRAEENQKVVNETFQKTIGELSAKANTGIAELLKNTEVSIGRLSESTKNTDKHLTDLGASVKTASTHVGSLEKNSREQQQLFQNTMRDSIKLVQEESSKVLKETMKAAVDETSRTLENMVKPAADQLNKLGESVERATKHVEEMERRSGEQQERIQKSLQDAIAKVQQESGRVLEDTMKNAVDRTQKALEDMNRAATQEISKMGQTVSTASEQAGNLGRIAQENQSKLQEAISESMRAMQSEAVKSLNETMRPAIQEISKLGESIRGASEQTGNLGRIAQENQSKLQEALSESTRKMQAEAIKSLQETMRPAVQEISKMGETVKSATSQMAELGTTARDSQAKIGQSISEAVNNMQKETINATRDTIKSAADSVASLGDTIKSITGNMETLAQQAQDNQSKISESMSQAIGQMQSETQKALAQTVATAGTNLGDLSKGINSLNEILSKLGGKQIVVETKKKGFFG